MKLKNGIFGNRMLFKLISGGFSDPIKTIQIQIGKNNWDLGNLEEKSKNIWSSNA